MFNQFQNTEGKVRATAVQLVDEKKDGTLRGGHSDDIFQGIKVFLSIGVLVQQLVHSLIDEAVHAVTGSIGQRFGNVPQILFEDMGKRRLARDFAQGLHHRHGIPADLFSGLLVRKFVPDGGQDAQQRVVHGLGGEGIQIDDGPFRRQGCRLGGGLFSVRRGPCHSVRLCNGIRRILRVLCCPDRVGRSLPGGLLALDVLFLYQIDELVAELGLARTPAAVDGHRAKVHLRIQQLDDLFRDALPVEFITVVKGQVFQRNRGLHSSLLEPHPALAGEQLLHERFLFLPQASGLLFQQHDLPVRRIQHGRNGTLLVEGGKGNGYMHKIRRPHVKQAMRPPTLGSNFCQSSIKKARFKAMFIKICICLP